MALSGIDRYTRLSLVSVLVLTTCYYEGKESTASIKRTGEATGSS